MKRMLIMTFLIFLVSTGISQDNKKNSISLGFGSVISNKIDSYSPVVDLSYRRNLTDKLGLNVGYKFKDCSYDTVYQVNSDGVINTWSDIYKVNSTLGSVYLGLTYNIKIVGNIYIVPQFNVGLGYASQTCYILDNKWIGVPYLERNRGVFAYINPSVNVEYDINRFRIFCSYSYDMAFVKTGFKNPFTTCDVKPYERIKMNNYFLSDLKLGVAFRF
ncbi:MAG: hypothetical protein E7065_03565 [Lentimicrobiaceae bacterium]|nr:hypothetical protein [Lentimicrobiaceae bacterium]